MSVTTSPTTAEASKKVKKEKKKFYKLNIRYLPRGITSDELLTKLNINPAPTRFWLRPGEPFLEYDARPYAFVVFDNFEVAAKFQQQWHGKTITAEATGEESVMLVEKAPNQDWAKQGLSAPKNARPITSHIDYIKFVEEAESRCITKQVDFDVLVNEIIERETKLAAGICQDTPLTDYFVKRAHDKLMKGRRVLTLKIDKLSTAPKFEKGEFKKDKPTSNRERPEKAGPKPRPPKPVKEKKESRERKPPSPKSSTSTTESAIPSTAPSLNAEAGSEKSGKPPRKRASRAPRGPKIEGEKLNVGEPTSSKPSSAPASAPKQSEKEPGLSSKPGPGAAKKAGPTNAGAGAGRNKDRPERAIYQPGRGRRYKPGGGGETRPATNPGP